VLKTNNEAFPQHQAAAVTKIKESIINVQSLHLVVLVSSFVNDKTKMARKATDPFQVLQLPTD